MTRALNEESHTILHNGTGFERSMEDIQKKIAGVARWTQPTRAPRRSGLEGRGGAFRCRGMGRHPRSRNMQPYGRFVMLDNHRTKDLATALYTAVPGRVRPRSASSRTRTRRARG